MYSEVRSIQVSEVFGRSDVRCNVGCQIRLFAIKIQLPDVEMSDVGCQTLKDNPQGFHRNAPFHYTIIAKFQLTKSQKDVCADDCLLSMKSSCQMLRDSAEWSDLR